MIVCGLRFRSGNITCAFHLPANFRHASMLSSSATLTHFVPAVLSKAIFTTAAAGTDAPKDPDALDEKLLKRAR